MIDEYKEDVYDYVYEWCPTPGWCADTILFWIILTFVGFGVLISQSIYPNCTYYNMLVWAGTDREYAYALARSANVSWLTICEYIPEIRVTHGWYVQVTVLTCLLFVVPPVSLLLSCWYNKRMKDEIYRAVDGLLTPDVVNDMQNGPHEEYVELIRKIGDEVKLSVKSIKRIDLSEIIGLLFVYASAMVCVLVIVLGVPITRIPNPYRGSADYMFEWLEYCEDDTAHWYIDNVEVD